mmetsp:Transcript_4102/g.9702  ORF Transcript_4102/g.9702 Transcript_4102/m.9702 type:complete len:537 (-) Transcript_4102:2202-3812(-)
MTYKGDLGQRPLRAHRARVGRELPRDLDLERGRDRHCERQRLRRHRDALLERLGWVTPPSVRPSKHAVVVPRRLDQARVHVGKVGAGAAEQDFLLPRKQARGRHVDGVLADGCGGGVAKPRVRRDRPLQRHDEGPGDGRGEGRGRPGQRDGGDLDGRGRRAEARVVGGEDAEGVVGAPDKVRLGVGVDVGGEVGGKVEVAVGEGRLGVADDLEAVGEKRPGGAPDARVGRRGPRDGELGGPDGGHVEVQGGARGVDALLACGGGRYARPDLVLRKHAEVEELRAGVGHDIDDVVGGRAQARGGAARPRRRARARVVCVCARRAGPKSARVEGPLHNVAHQGPVDAAAEAVVFGGGPGDVDGPHPHDRRRHRPGLRWGAHAVLVGNDPGPRPVLVGRLDAKVVRGGPPGGEHHGSRQGVAGAHGEGGRARGPGAAQNLRVPGGEIVPDSVHLYDILENRLRRPRGACVCRRAPAQRDLIRLVAHGCGEGGGHGGHIPGADEEKLRGGRRVSGRVRGSDCNGIGPLVRQAVNSAGEDA